MPQVPTLTPMQTNERGKNCMRKECGNACKEAQAQVDVEFVFELNSADAVSISKARAASALGRKSS